jgi:hypothetical protein
LTLARLGLSDQGRRDERGKKTSSENGDTGQMQADCHVAELPHENRSDRRKAGKGGGTTTSDELRRADEDELVIWH